MSALDLSEPVHLLLKTPSGSPAPANLLIRVTVGYPASRSGGAARSAEPARVIGLSYTPQRTPGHGWQAVRAELIALAEAIAPRFGWSEDHIQRD